MEIGVQELSSRVRHIWHCFTRAVFYLGNNFLFSGNSPSSTAQITSGVQQVARFKSVLFLPRGDSTCRHYIISCRSSSRYFLHFLVHTFFSLCILKSNFCLGNSEWFTKAKIHFEKLIMTSSNVQAGRHQEIHNLFLMALW